MSQEAGKSDDSLDSLMEKLADTPSTKSEKTEGVAEKPADKKAEKTAGTGQAGKPSKLKQSDPKKPRQGGGDVSAKDKELDDLLEKLGEQKDEPATDDSRKPGAEQPSGPNKPDSSNDEKTKGQKSSSDTGLKDKDKELDQILEELSGKKRKKRQEDEQEGTGPLGQIIKEMRDVEQRLGKPDTGEDTQGKQKQIVKQIDTLIEQMRQSGSSSMMALRRVRTQGQGQQKQGNQQGDTPGANPGGAPSMKPATPSDRHALAGGKDIWGHLPPELRQEMENVFKEEALPAREDLIRRYYLSIAKQKLVRGE
jgi:hypothetical protein